MMIGNAVPETTTTLQEPQHEYRHIYSMNEVSFGGGKSDTMGHTSELNALLTHSLIRTILNYTLTCSRQMLVKSIGVVPLTVKQRCVSYSESISI